MALPASGAISFAQIQTEFGGANPISLSEYWGTNSTPSGIPTSGTISMSNFHGKASRAVGSYTSTGTRASANIFTDMGSPTAVGDYTWTNNGEIYAPYLSVYAVRTGTFPAGSTLTIINNNNKDIHYDYYERPTRINCYSIKRY